MPSYVCLIQFKDQGIRNIKDTVKRGDAAIAEAENMGMKIVEEYWTMGAYDAVVIIEAPDDETMSAFILKVGSLGNVQGQTLRAFRRNEMEGILAKIKWRVSQPQFRHLGGRQRRWPEKNKVRIPQSGENVAAAWPYVHIDRGR